MRTVFADIFYFFALLNARDSKHPEAVAFANGFAGRLVTTAFVLAELANALCTPANRPGFLRLTGC